MIRRIGLFPIILAKAYLDGQKVTSGSLTICSRHSTAKFVLIV